MECGSAQAWLLALVVAISACSSDGTHACEPGTQRECGCGGVGNYRCHGNFTGVSIAFQGAETCSEDGTAWGRCDCLPPVDQDCVAACAPAGSTEFCVDTCSGQLGVLLLTLPAGSDPAACRAAFLAYVQSLPDVDAAVSKLDALDAACKPCCTQLADNPSACSP